MKSIDPGNGRLIQSYDPHTKGEIEIKIETLHSSQGKWSLKDFTQRGSYVLEVAEGLGNRKREFAQLIHDEMGKKISEAEAEIDKCISLCHYYIENAPTLLQNKDVQTELKSSYVSFQPLGIVLAIMPWNFPFWQVFRCAIPAIFSGNTVLLKHASNVTGCSLAIEDVFQTKSAAGLFQSVKVASSEIEPIIADSRISAI
ncbi:MAG: aldehyde dehydrogenase family protein, partial [Flavobacteriales bacterium]|nr:aldehyde dehydrogenase family protein [Flavobacteriales bacterium]